MLRDPKSILNRTALQILRLVKAPRGMVLAFSVGLLILRVVDLASGEGDPRFRAIRTRLLNDVTNALAEAVDSMRGQPRGQRPSQPRGPGTGQPGGQLPGQPGWGVFGDSVDLGYGHATLHFDIVDAELGRGDAGKTTLTVKPHNGEAATVELSDLQPPAPPQGETVLAD